MLIEQYGGNYMSELNVGIVGTQFMGRAHSNAWLDVGRFFELPVTPVLKAACGRQPQQLLAFAKRFGWQTTETDYHKLVERHDIDVIDICSANRTHKPIAVAAARAGKHVICEKPLATNADEARAMLEAVEEAGIRHMVAFNYRRVPAVQLAKRMIEDGRLGRIFHLNATYDQDWLVDPQFPFIWKHNRTEAGSGALGDLSAHTVDLARFLVGEFEAVTGSATTFINERPRADGAGTVPVTVDDTTTFLARFRNGAVGSFHATRFATGRKNYLRLELFGSEGSVIFNLERLNELQYFSRTDAGDAQGFRTIMVTEAEHPYLHLWWPPGHIIGWEHTFIHEIGDLVMAIHEKQPVYPDFYDGLRCQQVLDAVIQSINAESWVHIAE